MSIAKPTLTNVWASSGASNIADPGGVNDTGIPSGAKSIPRRWFNWVLHKIESPVRYLIARGVPDYDADEYYTVGDRVQKSIGGVYPATFLCFTPCHGAAPTGEDDDPNWMKWGYSAGDFAVAFASAFTAAFADAFDSRLGTVSAEAETGTVTVTAVDDNATIAYRWVCRFPGSTVKLVFVRLTLTAADHMSADLTLSGSAAFATGMDNIIVSIASMPSSAATAAHPSRAIAVVTNNQACTVGIVTPVAGTYVLEVMMQGH